MSYRTLIEINHDFAHTHGAGFVDALDRYLRSGNRETAEPLERFGVRVIAMRHHSEEFRVPDGTDGFPQPPESPSNARP